MNNREQAEAFTTWMRTKRDAPMGTMEKYVRLTRAWADFLSTDLADRTPDDVEAFTARDRRGGQPAANATVANELAVLGSLYRWGQARLAWDSNPAALAGRPKVHNRNPRPVDMDVWMHVWQQELPDDQRVALGLGYLCGLRREEMVRLRAGQVWGGALVNFTRKGGGEDRFDYSDVLTHWKATMPQLEAYRLEDPLTRLARRGGDSPLLPWGTGVRPIGLNKRMSRWLVQYGLASDSFTPHQLRHSFATNLLRSGVPLALACELCNHGSPSVTMRYIKMGGGQLADLRVARTIEVAQ